MEERDDAAFEVLGDINARNAPSLAAGKTSRGLRINGFPQYADLGRPRYESKLNGHYDDHIYGHRFYPVADPETIEREARKHEI